MRRILRIVLPVVVIAVALGACAREARVIPVRKMERIYREMFLADQWLADNPDKKMTADTTWFYEPIFEKYGYTLKDYQKSVDYYLNDPKRYAEMMGRVSDGLRAELNVLNKKLALEDKARFEADSIANVRKSLPIRDFHPAVEIFKGGFVMDSICFLKDSAGAYYLAPVVRDTMFLGPELIIRDTVSVVADSAVVDDVARPLEKSLRFVPDGQKRISKELKLLPSKELIENE